MIKIRLTKLGRKKVPFYRIVAVEALSKRDGKVISYLGTYDPLKNPVDVVLKEEEILNLLKNGAKPTRTVKSLLQKFGVWEKFDASPPKKYKKVVAKKIEEKPENVETKNEEVKKVEPETKKESEKIVEKNEIKENELKTNENVDKAVEIDAAEKKSETTEENK